MIQGFSGGSSVFTPTPAGNKRVPQFQGETPTVITPAPTEPAAKPSSWLTVLGNALMGTRYLLPIANIPQALLNVREGLEKRAYGRIPLDVLANLFIPGRGMVVAWEPLVNESFR